MAYNLGDRFLPPPKCERLTDPGAYEKYGDVFRCGLKPNKFPFLSGTPRKTLVGNPLWTHCIYNTAIPPKIPNCSSMKSKLPRFPYEAFSEKDLEDLICRCGLQPCECPIEGEEVVEKEEICQARVPRRLYKDTPPRRNTDEGLSAPSKRDRGFEIYPDGTQKRIMKFPEDCPPFYETRVHEATAFYHGCKWSERKSKRKMQAVEVSPGPADYQHEKKLTEYDLCVQNIRFLRKRASKQLRFLDMIERNNISEGRPGPASYHPREPKGTEIPSYGSKCERFPIPKYNSQPGPTTYSPKRDFDRSKPPEYPCLAKLPMPACFGIKAARFKTQRSEGPGPATYSTTYKLCQFQHCGAGVAPFGCSSVRFKPLQYEDDDDDSDEFADIEEEDGEQKKICEPLTWGFKSQTIRMKPLHKKFDEPSPADMPITNWTSKREPLYQYLAPFNSSLGRFQPWHNSSPVHGTQSTPGPGYYNSDKPKCQPAVNCGPLCRSPRFKDNRFMTPAPNRYYVGGGVDDVLYTYNKRLKRNMQNQHKFKWKSSVGREPISLERQENSLFERCIALCDVSNGEEEKVEKPVEEEATPAENTDKPSVKPKLLRCFLYKKSIPVYY